MTEWLEAGCPVVVVLDPVRKVATVYRPGPEVRFLDAADHLSIPDLLPGWAVPLAELFR
jgi:Uma2 family endonuclease